MNLNIDFMFDLKIKDKDWTIFGTTTMLKTILYYILYMYMYIIIY